MSDLNKIDIEIKKLNIVGVWGWDIKIDNCAICRNNIIDSCIECQANDTNDCTISWGVCNHVYHTHCISRWIKTKNICPMCSLEWELSKIEG